MGNILPAVCEVLKKGVSGIVVPGSSEHVKLVADTASLYNVPVIAPTATSEYWNYRSVILHSLRNDITILSNTYDGKLGD